jgi:hypothetical protein
VSSQYCEANHAGQLKCLLSALVPYRVLDNLTDLLDAPPQLFHNFMTIGHAMGQVWVNYKKQCLRPQKPFMFVCFEFVILTLLKPLCLMQDNYLSVVIGAGADFEVLVPIPTC